MPGQVNQSNIYAMITSSKIFAAFFTIMGIWSGVTAINGATHQYWLAYISLLVSAALVYDCKTEYHGTTINKD